ncbi:RagB/SusD family nutrient uptake outer membrane protein [Bacteroides sp. 224]|uniref:RagB/SusD family nutrient uptake outer membrane protein n=1 Tax=Bacteroides sp. 224 TaxID=2302936 RepID=UPI0013D6D291|nr:RagB/SusD family nutrient uptake outer membrane protein [Bacteroides sp. 224]NDV63696.1 RagB/SusD family nutrient uptake outer membrane protein [Bacteroides sp. 224]
MNTIKYILISAVICMTGLTGCLNDLNVAPISESDMFAEQAYSDALSYTQGLNKIYSVWALSGQAGAGESDISDLDPGNTVLLRSWWTLQEQTTDECKNAWGDAWCNEINGQIWGTNKVEPIEGVYQRCMFVVALTNEFMLNIGNAPEEVNKVHYAAEARFNRALAYYTLLDMFAIPPFITENNYSTHPAQLSREELFNWIESELTTIESDLPEPRTTYGRADKAALNALLARMYLNAEVYTGKERYTDCITACKKVIASGYLLADSYANLFKADNGENGDSRKEIIFPICFDGNTTQSYAMAAIILGSRGSSEFSLEEDGVGDGWDGFRGTQNLVNLFDFEDNDDKTAATILDKRGIFYDKGRNINIITSVKGTFTTEGWAVYKYKNITSAGVAGSNQTFPDTDFALFRLGDIYLMYAEAVARGGQGGDINTAVGYVNQLRERAFGNADHAINTAWLSANNFRNILDERGRELYWEGVRRTDLIRYGLFTSNSYLWPYKGGVITGVGIESHYNVFPIPATDLSVNQNLHQNEGYK